jgi:hypothetical protein
MNRIGQAICTQTFICNDTRFIPGEVYDLVSIEPEYKVIKTLTGKKMSIGHNEYKGHFSPFTTNIKEGDMANPLKSQVGGQHYSKMKIQPVEFITKNDLSYLQGNVIKYICRYKDKNGKEDLEKIKHYVDLIIGLEYEGSK